MCISNNNCPVPFEQQPLNEYLALKKSWLFSWSMRSIRQYFYIIFIVFIILFCVFGGLLKFLYSKPINLSKLFIVDLLMVDIVFFIIFFRIYLGWSYIVKRLLSATIFYEESGWYDGQIWVKTADSLTKDRLIGLYQILPFMSRIKYTCISLLISFIILYSIYRLF